MTRKPRARADVGDLDSQLGGANPVLALEQDRVGKDYAINVKAMNPNLTDLSGMYFASYLQSVSQHVALGVDAVYNRQAPGVEECSVGYMAKWHHTAKDENGQLARDSWIATAQILPQGYWQGSYWKKLGQGVEAAVDILVSPSPSPRERKAVATAGVKYEFRQSSFRGQVDSTGKVSALLEQRLSPAFAFLVTGEIDHAKVCPTRCGPHEGCADPRRALRRTSPSSVSECRSSRQTRLSWRRRRQRRRRALRRSR